MDINKIKKNIVDFYQSRKKTVWIGCAILVAAIAAAVILPAVLNSQSEQTTVQYGEVTRGAITDTIDVVGSLEAVPSATLSWETGGVVAEFTVKVGDKVSKGDVVMSLTDASLESDTSEDSTEVSILQAKSSLLEAQKTLEDLKAANTDLYTATQTLADAEYELAQYKTDRDYWNTKGASDEAIDAARSAYYAAKQVVWEKQAAYDALADLASDDPKKVAAYEEKRTAVLAQNKALDALNFILGAYYDYGVETDFIEYDAALAAVEEARVTYNRYLDQSDEIAAAEATVQAYENIINSSKIIAPFDGTISYINAEAGVWVASGTEAVRIDNMDNLEVEVDISEVDINKIMVGQEAVITFDAIPNKTYSGYVESISNSGTMDDNSVVQFKVMVKVADADEEVKPGFTSVVSIITDQAENALLVPNDAVVSQDGSYVVSKVNSGGSTTLVPVEIGVSSDVSTVITSGELSEGDKVVLNPSVDENTLINTAVESNSN